jgi:hypothetical protein
MLFSKKFTAKVLRYRNSREAGVRSQEKPKT